MNKLELMAHKVDVNARAFFAELQERREAGQGSIEYIGIAVIAAIVIAGIIFFFNNKGTEQIQKGLENVIKGIFQGNEKYTPGQ
ncbi:hypothetical protein QP572_10230 [Brevibacterium sp. UMB10442]|uniref:hypothetical protein n=1 Tax=Brevibacterium sp. UMB1308A TaxID=3050608 RepID=UPI00254A045C|nr:hypothetical protein [Brevibacterium sp. UMB1308A]MDK7750723.1 hypothetical protein [Brevibacterium sp. UMB10442]MDK8346271.1 hypothetical protein [Brevibacterium sp. UMB1308B]MDK8712489.1 hypothetical protein [Brevibacterium sp. UMB1308A]